MGECSLRPQKPGLLTLLISRYDELIDRAVQSLVRKRFELLRLVVVVHLFRGIHAICMADENARSRLKAWFVEIMG